MPNPAPIDFSLYPFGFASCTAYLNPGGAYVQAASVPGMLGPSVKKATHKTTSKNNEIYGNDALERNSARVEGEMITLEMEGAVNDAWLSFVTGKLFRVAGTAPARKALSGNYRGQKAPTICLVLMAQDDEKGSTMYGFYKGRCVNLPEVMAEYMKFGTVRKLDFAIEPDKTPDAMFLRTVAVEAGLTALDPTAAPNLTELATTPS